MNIVLRRPPADRDAALRQVVDTVFSLNQPFVNEGRLEIVFARGFNFAIAQFRKSEVASTDFAQWRAGTYPHWSAGKSLQWRAGIGSGRVLSIGAY